MNFKFFLIGTIQAFFLQSLLAQSVELDLFHTNDLHSYMDHLGSRRDLGGYPALRAHMDWRRQQAHAQGRYFISMNAGDFAEGNVYFWSQGGRRSFEALNVLGFDATVIGNHDWLMGPQELEEIFNTVHLDKKILAANVKIPSQFPGISRSLSPYQIYNYDGIKLAVIGLTTQEVLYSWQFRPVEILSPIQTAKFWVNKVREEHQVDYVVLLTHTGTQIDQRMAREVPGIDLIVGGHSHEYFSTPQLEKNKKSGALVPIVQVGEHGQFYGLMKLALEKGRPLQILSYQTPEIDRSLFDFPTARWVEEVWEDCELFFGAGWLEEKVARSTIRLETPRSKPTLWGDLITESIRAVIDADVAINVAPFMGHDQEAGDITRRTLVEAHPRTFETSHSEGWLIWDAYVPGWLIAPAAQIALGWELPLYFAGLEFDLESKGDKRYKVKNLKIDGKKINPLKLYRVALTEGFVRGGLGISKYARVIMRKLWKSPYNVWQAMEKELRRIGTFSDKYRPRSGKLHRTYLVPQNFYGGSGENSLHLNVTEGEKKVGDWLIFQAENSSEN